MSPYYDPTVNLDAQAQQKENKLVNLGLTKMQFPHISGLKLQEDVTLGSLTLNKLDSTTGVVWVMTNLDGWWTLPDPEFPDVARGWGDGSYDADGRYTARVLTLEGSFLTQSPSQVAEARAKLTAAVNLVYRGADLIVRERITLTATDIDGTAETVTIPSHGLVVGDTVTYQASGTAITGLVSGRTYHVKTAPTVNTITLSATSGGSTISITGTELAAYTKHTFEAVKPKVASVRISGKPQIETVNARGRTNFSIGLKAADPIKYEYRDAPDDGNFRIATLTRNTDVTVRNAGDTPVTVIFSMSGNTLEGEVGEETVRSSITNTVDGEEQFIVEIYKESSDSAIEIDTYSRNIVAFDSEDISRVGRKYANSYINWIQLNPGDNVLRFESVDSTATCLMYYRSGWMA
jgi:hypothetical protein